ncbi:MAG TPA: hypothetical protein VLA38_12255 [Steroidobacteraceae bacterium]|jgi:hypothetical protein|nr:hypothetical protein [Steroidobacteraceae bacterium]
MSEREEFSLDDDFDSDGEEDLDKLIVVGDRRPKPGRKSPQAAWSKLEDVLAERRLARELKDDYDVDEA